MTAPDGATDHRTPWLRWLLGGVAAGTAVAATTTWVAVRTLTDAPKGATRPAGYRLAARFAHDDDGRGQVLVSGSSADLAGTWGLAHPDGFVRVGDPVRGSVVVDRYELVRPFELLDGRLLDEDDRRRGDDRRSGGDRRVRDRRGGGPPPEVDPEEVVLPPAPVTPRRVEERRSGGRRRGDRRRGRDRRRVSLPPPWPVPARWSDHAFPDDPQLLARRRGAHFEPDCVTTAGGTRLPAWRFVPPEASDTWVVAVHGRGAPRTEVFRLVDIALAAGLPCLVVSYRTDHWTRDPTPLTTLGATEWEDVAAGMRQLVRDGARAVVLAGCSLGGAICAQVVRRSAMAPYVVGVVLDSPALSWGPILAHVARLRRLPTALVPPVMLAARYRARLDWTALDHLAAADDFTTPILLIHGTEDEAVPVWLSDRFAAARPDLVQYLRVEGARHVEAWNVDTERYTDVVTTFLEQCASP